MEVRCARVCVMCDTELAAAMLYNAVARKVWPGAPANLPPIAVSGDLSVSRIGFAFWLGLNQYAAVDQRVTAETPVAYEHLKPHEWFLDRGAVQRASWDPDRGFTRHLLREAVFGGPCRHLNGNPLDCRRRNLAGSGDLAEPMGLIGVPAGDQG